MSDSSYGSVYVEGVTYIDEREIAKRDAEIERLREGERAADAEIERLRSELDRTERVASLTAAASSVAGEALRKMDEANAEIEQLRGLVYAVPPTEHATGQTWKEACEANRKVVIELRAEIERLRSQLAAMECGYKSFRDTKAG